MVKMITDGETRRLAARGAAGLGLMAVVVVGLPVIENRAEHQAEDNEWRIKAKVLALGEEAVDVAATTERLAQVVTSAASQADLSTIAALRTFAPSHFDHAERQREDHECLARAIYYEARNEPILGQIAVAEVVLNRVKHRHFPNNICDVVYEGTDRATGLSWAGNNMSCQFSFTCDGAENNAPRGRTWRRAQDVASHILMDLSAPVTSDATHYHADYVDPYWAPSLEHTRTIGRHIFYRSPTQKRRGA